MTAIATPAAPPTSGRPGRPGWPEVAVGLVVMAVIGYGGGSQLFRLGLNPVAFGLVFSALSGAACLVGFAAALSIRIHSPAAFGIRRTSVRWLWIGAAVGIVAFVVKGFATIAFLQLAGDMANVQDVYAVGGSGGIWSLVLATILLAVLTPIGEKLLFRGVVTSALLRYGPLIGVVGSAAIFAVMHGVNMAFLCGGGGGTCNG